MVPWCEVGGTVAASGWIAVAVALSRLTVLVIERLLVVENLLLTLQGRK